MTSGAYVFIELDAVTRNFMLDELELDIESRGHPYLGQVLTASGLDDYVDLLRGALAEGTEVELGAALATHGRVEDVPVNAASRLACTEFNRYYIRGICMRASFHGVASVVGYRAHGSAVQRPRSVTLDGAVLPATRILANLRDRQGLDTESGLGRVNSGLSVRCGCAPCLEA